MATTIASAPFLTTVRRTCVLDRCAGGAKQGSTPWFPPLMHSRTVRVTVIDVIGLVLVVHAMGCEDFKKANDGSGVVPACIGETCKATSVDPCAAPRGCVDGGSTCVGPSCPPAPVPGSEGAANDGGADRSLIVFGGIRGQTTFQSLGDTWKLDADGAFSPLPSAVPAARGGHACASYAGGMLVYGGSGDKDPASPVIAALGDTWLWSAGSWTRRATSGPSPRVDASMATLGNTVVLFGGRTTASMSGETWVWDGTSWAKRETPGPSPRQGHVMVRFGKRVLLFGGSSANGPLDDTWEWDGSGWTARPGAGPSGRYYAAAAAFKGKIVLHGGVAYGNGLNDTWEWDGTSWTFVDGKAEQRRGGTMGVLDDRLFLFAGHGRSDLLEWTGASWVERAPMTPPGERFSHCMVPVKTP